jgi:uncharacterized membrane protein
MKHATITEATLLDDADLRSAAAPRGHAIPGMLVWFSAAYFSGALVTDLVYWRMPDVLWERFSIWLIAAGLVMAGLGVVGYVVDLAFSRRIEWRAWPRAVGYATAVLISLVNAFVHSRDGHTAVVPTGLMLSGLVVAVLILTAWAGAALADRQRIGG